MCSHITPDPSLKAPEGHDGVWASRDGHMRVGSGRGWSERVGDLDAQVPSRRELKCNCLRGGKSGCSKWALHRLRPGIARRIVRVMPSQEWRYTAYQGGHRRDRRRQRHARTPPIDRRTRESGATAPAIPNPIKLGYAGDRTRPARGEQR